MASNRTLSMVTSRVNPRPHAAHPQHPSRPFQDPPSGEMTRTATVSRTGVAASACSFPEFFCGNWATRYVMFAHSATAMRSLEIRLCPPPRRRGPWNSCGNNQKTRVLSTSDNWQVTIQTVWQQRLKGYCHLPKKCILWTISGLKTPITQVLPDPAAKSWAAELTELTELNMRREAREDILSLAVSPASNLQPPASGIHAATQDFQAEQAKLLAGPT